MSIDLLKDNIDSDHIEVKFLKEWNYSTPKEIMEILEKGVFIDYDNKNLNTLDDLWIIHGGEEQSYQISALDKENKYSLRYINCIGCVISGKTLDGERLSFLTHQDSQLLTNNKIYREKFYRDLFNQIEYSKKKLDLSTIDVKVFGGNGYLTWKKSPNLNTYYVNTLSLVDEIIYKTLWFHPIIAHSPKQEGGHNDVFFDTEKNILYIIWDSCLDDFYRPFVFPEYQKMQMKWEKNLDYKL